MTINYKPWLKIGLKILFAVVLLSWFLSKSDVSLIFKDLLSLSGLIFLSALLLSLVNFILKSYRWHLLLPQYSFKTLLKLNFISQYYAFFLAGQLTGEVAKLYILGKGKPDSGQIAMSILIDKIIGIIGMVLVAIFGLIFSSQILPAGIFWSFMVLIIISLLLIFLVQLRFFYKIFEKAIAYLKIKISKLEKFWQKLKLAVDAWANYGKQRKVILIGVIIGVLFQLIAVAINIIIAKNFGWQISFFDWCWILGILSVALVLPITIGGLGLREGTLVGLLAIFSVSSEKALTLSFTLFGIQLILAVIGGALELTRKH